MKEQQELCGPRLDRKINAMLNEYKKKAGMPCLETGGDEAQSMLLRTENSAMYRDTQNREEQKDVKTFGAEVKGQMAFFQLAKKFENSKYIETETHPKVKYLKECFKDNSIIIPLLNKIVEHALLIRDTKITTGQAKGLQASMMLNTNLITKLYLDDNNLDSS